MIGIFVPPARATDVLTLKANDNQSVSYSLHLLLISYFWPIRRLTLANIRNHQSKPLRRRCKGKHSLTLGISTLNTRRLRLRRPLAATTHFEYMSHSQLQRNELYVWSRIWELKVETLPYLEIFGIASNEIWTLFRSNKVHKEHIAEFIVEFW